MPQRMNLPGADELFRGKNEVSDTRASRNSVKTKAEPVAGPTGRIRHDEKITVYVSTEELLNLEQTRLRLRAEYGINVDRGRLVRVAIDMLTEELASGSENPAVLERLK